MELGGGWNWGLGGTERRVKNVWNGKCEKGICASVASERGGTEGFVASSQKLRFVNSLLVKRETNIFSNKDFTRNVILKPNTKDYKVTGCFRLMSLNNHKHPKFCE